MSVCAYCSCIIKQTAVNWTICCHVGLMSLKDAVVDVRQSARCSDWERIIPMYMEPVQVFRIPKDIEPSTGIEIHVSGGSLNTRSAGTPLFRLNFNFVRGGFKVVIPSWRATMRVRNRRASTGIRSRRRAVLRSWSVSCKSRTNAVLHIQGGRKTHTLTRLLPCNDEECWAKAGEYLCSCSDGPREQKTEYLAQDLR
jgi:hypothetical protein